MARRRSDRFNSYLGRGCWPQKGDNYVNFCNSQVATLSDDHWEVYERCKKYWNGDWVKAMLASYTSDDIHTEINLQLMDDSNDLADTGGYVFFF